MAPSRTEKLVGIVVSLPTFTDTDHKVLLEPLRKHVRWPVEKGLRTGSAVLMGAAGLGEGYFLSYEEYCGIVDVLAEAAEGKVPTMAGTFELSAREAARKAPMQPRPASISCKLRSRTTWSHPSKTCSITSATSTTRPTSAAWHTTSRGPCPIAASTSRAESWSDSASYRTQSGSSGLPTISTPICACCGGSATA